MTRLRRSELSTPGSSEKMMARAASLPADLVFLDLEDSVAPTEKAGSRRLVVEALRGLDWGQKTLAVRVNGVNTEWAHDDLIEVVTGAGSKLDLIIVPKVKAPRDLWFVETLLEQLEAKLRLPNRIGLEALIEETEALAYVEDIAGCSPRLEALILGVGDLSASQGIRTGHVGQAADRYPGDIWHYARNRMIVAARSRGLDAIDGPFANFRDPDGYRREATWAATLGCVGKWAIHPDQIGIANEVFAPTDAEVARARRAVDAVRTAEAAGAGAATLDGVMIDAATARIFQVTLDRSAMIASRDRA
ncbi:MAG TPA: CoA ester lyase [Candidatus Dormibacteraeota bacterium]|nr:CoA ester lyase [Candidatus Dormibacteraeota bacterium]